MLNVTCACNITLMTRMNWNGAKAQFMGEFDDSMEDWETYVEHVEIYLTANAIKNTGQKRAVLLSVCGPKTYATYLSPPTDLSYNDIVPFVQKH